MHQYVESGIESNDIDLDLEVRAARFINRLTPIYDFTLGKSHTSVAIYIEMLEFHCSFLTDLPGVDYISHLLLSNPR